MLLWLRCLPRITNCKNCKFQKVPFCSLETLIIYKAFIYSAVTSNYSFSSEDLHCSKNNRAHKNGADLGVSSEDRELSRNIVVSSNSVANILASEHLSLSSLRRMWKLTRSDMGGTLRCASYRLPYHL